MIFVTGGTGLLGSHLIKHLSEKGEQILAIRREESTIPDLIKNTTTVEWVLGDLFDITLLENAIERCSTVIHAAAIVTFSTNNLNLLYKTNVETTKSLIDIALSKPHLHFIHVSSVAALGRDGTNLNLTENATWSESEGNTNYARSKHLAEVEVWRGIEEGLNASIVNPSVIIGECNINKSSGILFKRIFKNSKYYPTGSGNFVDVNDVVTAISILLDKKISGERFILNGFSLENKDLYTLIASEANLSLPNKEITKKTLTYLKPLENFFSLLLFKTAEISSDTLKLIGTNYTYDNTKSKTTLGLVYTDKKETITKTTTYFLKKLTTK